METDCDTQPQLLVSNKTRVSTNEISTSLFSLNDLQPTSKPLKQSLPVLSLSFPSVDSLTRSNCSTETDPILQQEEEESV